MKTQLCIAASVLLLAQGACSKKKEGEDSSKSGSSAGAASAAGAPLDLKGADALWALAPKETLAGGVIAPGAGAAVHGIMTELLRVVEARPLGALGAKTIRGNIAKMPVDILDLKAIKKAGIDLNGGAAAFAVGTGEDEIGFIVLPVTDRAAFRSLVGGTTKKVDGLEVDTIMDLHCTQKEKRYVCATSVKALATFGAPVNGPLAKRVAGLPAKYRGQIEAVGDLAAESLKAELSEELKNPKLGVVAARFGGGAFTVRAWIQGEPAGPLAGFPAAKGILSKGLLAQYPTGLFRAQLPPALWEAGLPGGDMELPAGLKMKDVVGNLTGEMIAFAPGGATAWGRVALGIRDPAPFKTLMTMGCGLLPAAGLPGITVTPGDGKCAVSIDVSKLPLPKPELAAVFKGPIAVVAEIKDDQISIDIGAVSDPDTSVMITSTGKELMEDQWSFAMWAQSLSVVHGMGVPWGTLNEVAPAQAVDGIKLGLWLAAHLHEFGVAAAVREDGLHGFWHVATYAGDPPDAYAAYATAVNDSLDGKDTAAAFKTISSKWPDSMAGRQVSQGGSMILAGIGGMIAAIAIPAFEKYVERSKEARKGFLD